MNAKPPMIRIEHDATAVHPLRIQTIRLDIGAGEPQALSEVIECAAGESVRVPLYFGSTLVLQEPR